MAKYKATYLEQHNVQMLCLHSSPEPSRPADSSFVVRTVAKADGPTESTYADVKKTLCSMELYDPIFFNDYICTSRSISEASLG